MPEAAEKIFIVNLNLDRGTTDVHRRGVDFLIDLLHFFKLRRRNQRGHCQAVAAK